MSINGGANRPSRLRLELDYIDDEYTRNNFELIQDFINRSVALRANFTRINYVTDSVGVKKIPHTLCITPSDVIITASTGTATVDLKNSNANELCINVTQAGTFTFWIGKYV